MGRVLNFGTTIQNIKANIKKERNMVKECIHGKMGPNTLVTGMKIEFTVKENTHGMMEDSMKVIGKIIIWMAMASTPGKMAENMKDSTKRIKNMEMEFIPGLMAENMMENGKMEGNMAEENIYLNKASTEKVFGKTVKEKDGLMELNTDTLKMSYKTQFEICSTIFEIFHKIHFHS